MNSTLPEKLHHTSVLTPPVAGLLASLLLAWPAASWAANPTLPPMYHLSPAPGGVPAQPTITSITPRGTNTTVCWYGLEGWYGVEMSADGTTGWTSVGRAAATDFASCLTVTNGGNSNAFFRLSQDNAFVGSGGCAGCHGDQYSRWLKTGHASALDLLSSIGMGTNPACIGCHTVGYGQPGGYTDSVTTPQLSDVGCENCHGPAGWHKYSDHDLIRPPATIAAEVCGGCHTDAHHPTYDEWKTSPHSAVTGGLQTELADPVSGPARQMACGACHSGAVRLAMLNNQAATAAGLITSSNALVLPNLADAGSYGVTCVTCHDPHASTANPHQLRNPVFSTNFFSFSTTAVTATNVTFSGTNVFYVNTGFNSQYNTNLQICAQCHNQRGARWTDNSRPPHHSPQYNVLIGDTGFASTAPMIGAHGLRVTNQCVQCHTFSHGPDPASPVSDTNRFFTGHTFQLTLSGCAVAGCHSSTNIAASMVRDTQADTEAKIQSLVTLLQTWGSTKAPQPLRTNYGPYAWEYQNAGQLSSPTPSGSTTNGPPAAQQALIPDAIRKARFALYLAEHDASKGVHNGDYTRFLLNYAKTNVQAELNKP